MDLAFLDKDFNLVRYFKFINLQWNRKYYEPGDFSVQIPSIQFDNNAVYVYTKDRPEVGIIQKVEHADGYDGDVVQLSGYFYEYKLNDKIIYPRYNGTGNIETIAREIVTRYKDDIPLVNLANANNPLLGSNTTKQETGSGIATTLYNLLKTQQLSYKLQYDFTENKMYFKVWNGKDRTQNQNINSFVTFSDSLKNIQNEKTTIDSSRFKNYGIVIGNGKYEEGNQIQVDIDLRQNVNDYKQIIYIDKTGMNYNAQEQTLEVYKDSLRQAGLEDLEKYNEIKNFTFDTLQKNDGLRYMEDYDIGDLCDVFLSSINASYVVRITEINEVFKESIHRITLQFGDKLATVYERKYKL